MKLTRGKETPDETAFRLGQNYGKRTRLATLGNHRDSEAMYRAARQDGCPVQFFDLFKYGAQKVWRKKGEL